MKPKAALIWAGVMLANMSVFDYAQARDFSMLYSFQGGKDGSEPLASLAEDKQGNLYGTTFHGGNLHCDCGTVFKFASDRTETVLHAFGKLLDGTSPQSSLVIDRKGNLYGTTYEGGSGKACHDHSCGVVFKVLPDRTEKILYSFQGGNDGGQPASGLFVAGSGDFYGVTTGGGGTGCKRTKGCGTVYMLAPRGLETVVYRFQPGIDGTPPLGNLIMDEKGNLYGTTEFGGGGNCGGKLGCGTVFKVAPDGTETVLHAFTGADGAFPTGGVVLDSAGNLYGTTNEGGSHCGGGCGVIFKLAPNSSETLLYSFCAQASCADGSNPASGLVVDGSGNYYGTTSYGGDPACDSGCGIVYKITPGGAQTVLHSFASSDGAYPTAGLILGESGTLFGTTAAGGSHQAGVIFGVTTGR